MVPTSLSPVGATHIEECVAPTGLFSAGYCNPTTYVVGYDVPSLRDSEQAHS